MVDLHSRNSILEHQIALRLWLFRTHAYFIKIWNHVIEHVPEYHLHHP